MPNKKIEIGYSLSNWGRRSSDQTLETLDLLDKFDYSFIEFQARGVDHWVQYPVLEKLNAHKRYDHEGFQHFLNVCRQIKQRGKRVGIWSHDLWFECNVLEFYPELATAKGDINLSDPLIEAYVRGRMGSFFAAAPEVDFIVLTLTETTFPVMQRFDNQMTPLQATIWLLRIYDDLCRFHKRELVVRPFSANTRDYQIIRDALTEFPKILAMEKSDPYDWNPFLPLSPFLAEYPHHRKVMEMDLSAEYFGGNIIPSVCLGYIKDRIEYGQKLGIDRIAARINRYGRTTLKGINRVNAFYFNDYFKSPDSRDPGEYLRQILPTLAPKATDANILADILERAFACLKHVFWVDGQRLFHSTFGAFEGAINLLFFETIRPNNDLAHAVREWAILEQKTTPSADAIRKEKLDALAEANQLLQLARQSAAAYPDVIRLFENLVVLADVYCRLTLTVQAYLQRVGQSDGDISREVRSMNQLAQAIQSSDQTHWTSGVFRNRSKLGLGEQVRNFAEQILQTFKTEQALHQHYKIGQAGLEDVILCGMPNEGHCPAKTSHGANVILDEGRYVRRLHTSSLGYTSQVSPGQKKITIEVRGFGRFSINGTQVMQFNDPTWQTYSFDVTTPDGRLEFLAEKIGNPEPCIRLIAIHVP
jgi:hypothetical protein